MSLIRILLLVLIPGIIQAQTYSKRLALVIGNSAYQSGGTLKNPVNDVRSMATALQAMGFEVMKYENVTQAQMKQAINSFGQKLREHEVGLFYYAGHGIQHKGTNYMIPIEADLQAPEQIEFDCVAADRVLAYMESASTKLNIIVMDACRNNPFERSWHRSVEGSGLALMNAPTGSIIAYATAPGRVASDGESSNGLYTSALLKYMRDPGLNIEQVFKRVRTEVAEKSMGAQVPWETTSLTGSDFYFGATGAKPQQAVTTKTAPGSLTAVDYYSRASEHYDNLRYQEAIADYSRAIELNGVYFEAWLWRGHAYYAIGDYNNGLKDYNTALDLSPGESQAYYYRALCKYYLNQMGDAIADFSLSIKYDRQYANGYFWRGFVYYAQAKYYAAIEDFTKTIELSPNYVESHYNRGLSHYNVEDYQKALVDFTQTLKVKEDYYDALYWMANTHFMLKAYDQALANYTAYLKQKPDDAEALYWRAYTQFNLNDRAKALADIDHALKLKPDNETYKTFKNELMKK